MVQGAAFAGTVHDLEFQEIAQRFLCGDVTGHGTLTDVQKALIRLAALVACQTWKPLAQYARSALDVGATPVAERLDQDVESNLMRNDSIKGL